MTVDTADADLNDGFIDNAVYASESSNTVIANDESTSEDAEDKPKYPATPAQDWRKITIKPFRQCNHVSPKQGEIVHKALVNGKRHFGVAGASLTWMNSPQMKGKIPEGWKPEVLDEAAAAEAHTTEMLMDWMKDKPAAVLIDSMHIPGVGEESVIDEETGLVEGGDTDHILIIGSHVYVIDTKNWKKKAKYTVGDDGSVLRNGKSFPGGRVHSDAATKMWYDYLDSDDAEVVGAICIDNGDEPDPKTGEWATSVFRNAYWWKHYWFLIEPSRWVQWLDEKYSAQAGYDQSTGKSSSPEEIAFIDPALIAQIAVACVKPYNRRDGLINMKAFKM